MTNNKETWHLTVTNINIKYKLFLLALPFVAYIFIFYYLPLYGWAYAFYNFKPAIPLFQNEFVGFKNFLNLVNTMSSRRETIRVITNTFAISFLGIACSILPVLFAIFLSEIRSKKMQRFIQTTTTLPNFISWVLVYSIMFSMFSVDNGFINNLFLKIGLIARPTNILGDPYNVWIIQTLIGVWKGLGWGAIVYLAAINGIDREQYDAAAVDGAGRLQTMWHITVPGIMPTYFVLLMLAVAGIINNGLDQYFVFQNPMTKEKIEVLDLYVYNQGIASINYAGATAIGIFKSVVSISLLMLTNGISKRVRGYKIF